MKILNILFMVLALVSTMHTVSFAQTGTTLSGIQAHMSGGDGNSAGGSKVIVTLSGKGWEDGSTLQIKIGSAPGLTDVYSALFTIRKMESGYVVLSMTGERSYLQADKVTIEVPVAGPPAHLIKAVTASITSVTGKESNKVSASIQ